MSPAPARAARAPYRHEQRGNVMLAMNMGLVVLFAVLSIGIRRSTGSLVPAIGLLAGIVIILTVGAIFGTLVTEVADGELRVTFGRRFTVRRAKLAEIAATDIVRTRWWQGIGIRFTRQGTLYNVATGPAVVVTLASGRRFLVGTDDPEGLRAAIGVGGAGGVARRP